MDLLDKVASERKSDLLDEVVGNFTFDMNDPNIEKKVSDAMFYASIAQKDPNDVWDYVDELNVEYDKIANQPSRVKDATNSLKQGWLRLKGLPYQIASIGTQIGQQMIENPTSFTGEVGLATRPQELSKQAYDNLDKTTKEKVGKYENEIYKLYSMAQSPELAMTHDDVWADLTNLIFANAPQMIASAASGLVGGAPSVFVSTMMIEGMDAKEGYLIDRVNKGYELTEQDYAHANLIGGGVGIITAIPETLGFKGVENIFEKAALKYKSKLIQAGYVVSGSMITESITETLQEVPHLAAEATYRLDEMDWNEVITRLVGSAAGGATLGAFTTGSAVGTKRIITGRVLDTINNLPDAKSIENMFNPEPTVSQPTESVTQTEPTITNVTQAPAPAVEPQTMAEGEVGYRYGKEGDIEFWSKQKDYAEEYALEKGGKVTEVKQGVIKFNNPLTIEMTPKEFSDPVAERKWIKQAKENGNDGVIFNSGEDVFYVKIKSQPAPPVSEPQTMAEGEVGTAMTTVPQAVTTSNIPAYVDIPVSLGEDLGKFAVDKTIEERYATPNEIMAKQLIQSYTNSKNRIVKTRPPKTEEEIQLTKTAQRFGLTVVFLEETRVSNNTDVAFSVTPLFPKILAVEHGQKLPNPKLYNDFIAQVPYHEAYHSFKYMNPDLFDRIAEIIENSVEGKEISIKQVEKLKSEMYSEFEHAEKVNKKYGAKEEGYADIVAMAMTNDEAIPEDLRIAIQNEINKTFPQPTPPVEVQPEKVKTITQQADEQVAKINTEQKPKPLNLEKMVDEELPSARGARNEDVKRERRIFGMEEIASPTRKSNKKSFDIAFKEDIAGRARDIAKDILTNQPIRLDKITEIQAGLRVRLSQLERQKAPYMSLISKETNPQEIKLLSSEVAHIQEEMDLISEALIKVGTPLGQGMQIRQALLELEKDTYSLTYMRAEVKKAKGDNLTEQESKKIEELSSKMRELEAKIAEQEATIKELQAKATMKKRGYSKYGEITKEQLNTEIGSLVNEIRSLKECY